MAEVTEGPVPSEAFERYPGQWVALRDGVVIAAAHDLAALEEDERVQPSDALFAVPEPHTLRF
jgi:hypothetical protein